MSINPIQGIGKAAGGIYNKTIGRLFGAGLNKGAESPLTTSGKAKWSVRGEQTDWRVKLTIPQDSDFRTEFLSSKVMSPLLENGGVVFPLTPSVLIQHTASYNPLAVTHSNYPFYAYGHSETSSLTIVGEFPVQNSEDALAWIATLHFFRTVTKMFFGGDTSRRGNPPPILKLNGYGDYVFKNVPVVVTNFTVELTQGVDYIATSQFDASRASGFLAEQNKIVEEMRKQYARGELKYEEYEDFYKKGMAQAKSIADGSNLGWAPTSSIFTVQVQPVYSRENIKNFSLEKFAAGGMINQSQDYLGDGEYTEGIGFI
jgi:hypothetical protein